MKKKTLGLAAALVGLGLAFGSTQAPPPGTATTQNTPAARKVKAHKAKRHKAGRRTKGTQNTTPNPAPQP